MHDSERDLELLENIVRLRRTQRRLPPDRDLSRVRASLERDLGDAVSRRLAARFLGISHTALNRWIESGDLPLVLTPQGRRQLPVPALLELRESVDRERVRGTRRRHILEPVMIGRRARAGSLPPAARAPGGEDGHRRAERSALAYHLALAPRLDSRMVGEALHRVWRWRDEGKLDPRYADEWERVLAQPIEEVREAITEDTARGRELRQNTPFAGFLSEPERHHVLATVT